MIKLTLTQKTGFDSNKAGLLYDDTADLCLSFTYDKHPEGMDVCWYVAGPEEIEAIKERLSRMGITGPMQEEEIDEDINWLERAYQAHPPLDLPPFLIIGSHFDGTVPEDRIPLLIDAATAFGSGTHPTTSGCLKTLIALSEEETAYKTILDLGTGSGILALAAAKLWPDAIVHASDNDPESITVTRRHADANHMADALTCFVADGTDNAGMMDHYDLVIANILAGPLMEMAESITEKVAQGGTLVLSGILAGDQAAQVEKKYTQSGLSLIKTTPYDEWVVIHLQKK